jgi:protein arginine N-methyltransferase 1
VAVYGDSRHVDLPERADLAIADQIGPLGIGGGLFSVLNDARRRLLKPGGVTIPARVALSVALAEYPRGLAPIEFWEAPHLGFDMGAMREAAGNVGYETRVGAAELLSAPAQVLVFDPARSCVEPAAGSTTLTAGRAGVLHGLFGFFSAELSPGVFVSNSPLGADAIDRCAWFMPFGRPTALEAGDSAAVTLHVMPVEETVTWRAEIGSRDGGCKARFAHSTVKGKPLAQEALRPLRPDYIPRLSPRGEIERTVLELCDGVRGVPEIAHELTRRFPGRFSGTDEAEVAVLRVVGSRAE